MDDLTPNELDAYAARCKEVRKALDANAERLAVLRGQMDQVIAFINDAVTPLSLERWLRYQRTFYETCRETRTNYDERRELHRQA